MQQKPTWVQTDVFLTPFGRAPSGASPQTDEMKTGKGKGTSVAPSARKTLNLVGTDTEAKGQPVPVSEA